MANQYPIADALNNLLSGALKPVRMVGEGGVAGAELLANLLGIRKLQASDANPVFMSPQEMQQFNTNPGQTTVQNAASAASWAIPFGKGASILSKVLAPGAAVGGLQGASQDLSPQSIEQGAVLGATGAGALHGLLGIPGLVGKGGDLVQAGGNALRQDVSKIQQPASIYGASQEKAIQGTLDKLGIKGGATQKYQQLLPAYQGLSDQIEKSLTSAPKQISLDQIKNDLTTNLSQKPTLDLAGDKAKEAVNNVLNSLYRSGDQSTGQIYPTAISTPDLFKLKQGINEGYGQIVSKLQNGQPLTDTEKVLSVARKTIDDIIANAHPDVKQATTMQSHLYDAAQSLSQSRNTDSSVQVLGTKVPTGVVKPLEDILGLGLQKTGQALGAGNKINSAISNPILSQIIGQNSARAGGLGLSSLAPQPGNDPEGPNGQVNNNASLNEPNNQVHTSSIAPDVNQNATSGGQKISPQMVSAAYLLFPKIKADKIAAAYQAQFAKGSPPDPADKANSDAGVRDLSKVTNMIQTDPNVILKKTIPGSVGAREYKAAETDMLNNYIYLKTGKQASDPERKSYESLLPQIGDPQSTIKAKLQIFSDYFNQRASGQ
jgi:hypothetical protein